MKRMYNSIITMLKNKFTKLNLSVIISIFALCISGYTLWDSNCRIKLDLAPGKQVDLFVCSNERNPMQPSIHMNIAFINSGGKTAILEDVKLVVEFITKEQILLSKEFISFREIINSVIDVSAISGLNRGIMEVSPIVILGKTSILKKYVFIPSEIIPQNQIPEKFDLHIKIYTKTKGKWIYNKDFYVPDNVHIWKDLDSVIHRSSIREIELKN